MTERRYTLSLLDDQIQVIQRAFAHPDGHERAGYLFCRSSVSEVETRLVVRAVEIVSPDHIVSSSPEHISISSRSYVSALSRADQKGLSLVLVHNHPGGHPTFSAQDDKEEAELFRTAFIRCPHGPHGSVVLVGGERPNLIGRVWVDEGHHVPIARIRVVGKRTRIFDGMSMEIPPWADRQVRAFGREAQQVLSSLNIGVVGAGGTGSAVCEQLIRLGVGQITVIDEQDFEDTNVNRVYGASLFDSGIPKVNLVGKQAAHIATGTQVVPVKGSVCERKTLELLRSCDIVFSCTDDNLGRSLLNRLAIWYYIPVIDLAVVIDSAQGVIREVTGRVTTLMPGSACLRCRGRISQSLLDAESLQRSNPEEYRQRVREGYAQELNQRNPAVIMFTTGIAARAVTEFMQLLTGFMGDDRTASEVLERFHETEVRTNNRTGEAGCYCTSPQKWGMADEQWFLGVNW